MNILKIFKNNTLLTIAIASFFIASFVSLKYPGLQYDEVLFVNAARGRIGSDKSFIYKEIFGIPVFLMQYIGALKSYIYYPIFYLFGINFYTIRIPTIIISILSIVLLHKAIQKFVNLQLANLVSILLALNSVFINLTRTDVGPNTIEFFLKAIGIFLILKYKNIKSIFLPLTIVFVLGVFNKLNFIWFVNSSLAVFIYLEIIRPYKQKKLVLKQIFQTILLPVLSWLIGIILFLLISKTNSIESSLNIDLNLIHRVFENIKTVINQTAYFNYALGYQQGSITLLYTYFIFIVVIAGFWQIWKYRNSNFFDFYIISWIFLISTFIQIVITPKATAPWHWFTIEPFFTFILASSIYMNFKIIKLPLVKFMFLSIILAYLVFQIITHQQNYRNPTNPIWSPQIYSLMDFSKSAPFTFVSVDWGFHNQFLINATNNDNKFIDLSFPLNLTDIDEYTQKNLIHYANGKNTLFVLHSEEATILKQSRKNFFNILENSNINFRNIEKYSQNNKIVYEIYETY
jgi:hypothetical protein